jgi:hypothetical protein
MKCIIAFCFLVTTLFSQNKEVAESIISKTEIAIYKFQKEINRSNEHSKINKLILAAQYQVKAVQLFKDLNFSDAISFSLKSREICTQSLTELGLSQSQLSFYFIESSEITFYKEEVFLNFNPENNISTEDIIKPEIFLKRLIISVNNN